MFWSLPVWHKNARRICAAVRRAPGPVKILLKVRNDPIFLAEWHRHHAAIVGAQNLIIADNMSEDPQTKKILRELARVSCVFRFTGFHNRLSDRTAFADLWQAIDDSSQWYLALDADERLGWIEADRCITDSRLVDRLLAAPPRTAAIPALLLDNVTGAADRFVVRPRRTTDQPMLPCAMWGKPAIATGHPFPEGGPIHNIQFPPALFEGHHASNLIQMHLCNLVPEQRLRTNREKLAARHVCTSKTPFHEIANIDLKGEKRNIVNRCVQETRKLLAQIEAEASPDHEPASFPPHLHIGPDGQMTFSTPEVATRLSDIMKSASRTLSRSEPVQGK